MKRFVLGLFSLSVLPVCVAQQGTPGLALIESRQAEVSPLARMLYGIDLRQGTWSHTQADICPAFTHHVFARYTRTDPAGKGASFIAVYDVDVPPAPSLAKPWQGGILLVPLQGGADGLPIERHGTTIVFNKVLAEESHNGLSLKNPDWNALAECYIALGGEQALRLANPAPEDQRPVSEPLPVSSILVPLVSAGEKSRAVHIDFDPSGFVTAAEVTVGPV